MIKDQMAQPIRQVGTIQGIVLDGETQKPLIGANVFIKGTALGAAADTDGRFTILNVPVGSYVLEFQFIGYEAIRKSDVIVKPERISMVQAELKESEVQAEAVEVTAGYFAESEEQPTSSIGFSYEEIRRAPGSAGDVSRIIMSLPSIAKINDQTNNLIVRGGSPSENCFMVDNIEIPNINHFPTQGSSGGPLSLINVDLIQDVQFYSGGFSSLYGDKLSSVMNLSFREGNRQEFDGQLDLNFSGFGAVLEGPLPKGKGSWLFSIRRSYLDLLVDAFETGTSVAPRYGDSQLKLVYSINPNHKLIFLNVYGNDYNNPDRKSAIENDMQYYGRQSITEETVGLNWQALWKSAGYSNTSISYTVDAYDENFKETGSDIPLIRNDSKEHVLKFRNQNHFKLNSRHSFDFGLDVKYLYSDYSNRYYQLTNESGQPIPELDVDQSISGQKSGVFVDYEFSPVRNLKLRSGVRLDHFSINETTTLSPRFSLSYSLTHRTTLTAAWGIYSQGLPMIMLAQNESNRELPQLQAQHAILGIEYLLTENTRLSLEIYQKDYRHFPIDPTQPALFLIDEIYYRYGFFYSHGDLVDTGKAWSRGIELTIQKKLAEKVYGLASASWFKSRYQGGDNQKRDRVFDNRYLISLEGGYKPNHQWEFSTRWIFAGGSPFTPFDITASSQLNREVLDMNRINQERYPNYHSMNVRFDRRFHFSGSNLVFYFSVWNVYNRKNVANYFWNKDQKKQGTIYQWSLLPIFGLEYEF